MQALELVLADGEIGTCELVDRGKALRVVRGELREDGIRRGEQLARAGDIGDVRIDFPGVDREAVETVELGALDLGVPVGALDEAHHHAPAGAAGKVDDVVEHEGAALAVGLHDEAEAVPALEVLVEGEAFEEVQRKLQPVGFLGVDVETDVVALGDGGERLHLREKLGHDAFGLRADIARMQCRELDGNAGAFIDAAPGRGLADGVDGGLVVAVVPLGVGGRRRGLAQHVVGIAETAGLKGFGALQRLVDRLAGDELFSHHAHRHVDAAADDRLAGPRDEARQRGGKAAVVDRRGELAGDDEAPGGRVDEHRLAAADMGGPVALGDLVADQRIARIGVGNAQQGFGKAHQRHAFLARQRIFLHQALDARALVLGAQCLDQRAGGAADVVALALGNARGGDERRQAFRLGAAVGGGDRLSQVRLRADRRGEMREGGGGVGGLVHRRTYEKRFGVVKVSG